MMFETWLQKLLIGANHEKVCLWKPKKVQKIFQWKFSDNNFFRPEKFLLACKWRHGILNPMMYDTWLESHWSDLQVPICKLPETKTQPFIWFPIKRYIRSKIKILLVRFSAVPRLCQMVQPRDSWLHAGFLLLFELPFRLGSRNRILSQQKLLDMKR